MILTVHDPRPLERMHFNILFNGYLDLKSKFIELFTNKQNFKPGNQHFLPAPTVFSILGENHNFRIIIWLVAYLMTFYDPEEEAFVGYQVFPNLFPCVCKVSQIFMKGQCLINL